MPTSIRPYIFIQWKLKHIHQDFWIMLFKNNVFFFTILSRCKETDACTNFITHFHKIMYTCCISRYHMHYLHDTNSTFLSNSANTIFVIVINSDVYFHRVVNMFPGNFSQIGLFIEKHVSNDVRTYLINF